MFRFLSKKSQTKTGSGKNIASKDKICTAVNEAWKLSDEISDMGARQTSVGWDIAERACHIEDGAISDEIADVGTQQIVIGMGVSEYACNLDDQLSIIAKKYGCKLSPRSYD